MNQKELIKKITSKKEFSQLPKKDVELAFSKFDTDKYLDEEKIKLTRSLLKRVFGAFSGKRLFSKKLKETSWILAHHVSSKERLQNYSEVYSRLLKNFKGSVIDLGCGVNGFSYNYFPNKVNYIGIESIGQFVDLTNNYFRKNKIKGIVYHLSLFELEKIKKYIKQIKGAKCIFLFKTLDSLEMLERNYSKKLLKELMPLVDTLSGHENLSRGKTVVSFTTKSLIKREKFRANKKWLVDFIKENFKVLDEFEVNSEKYLVFENNKI